MYDADEFSNDLKGTAASTANAIKTGYQIIEFLQNKDPEQIAALAVNDPSFQFTGQVTDLQFFQTHAVMSMDMVTNIQDDSLRVALFLLTIKHSIILLFSISWIRRPVRKA